jgi:hypothetical protein
VESANITHQFNFASHLPAHLATMFSMSWFGIPNFDPQVIFSIYYRLFFCFAVFLRFSFPMPLLFITTCSTLHHYNFTLITAQHCAHHAALTLIIYIGEFTTK